jgi:choline dehydrogenase-like flavoprotein
MKLGFQDYRSTEAWDADVCIIGAGAGGSATATALAEAGLRVIVLEAGSHWEPSQFKQDSAWALRNLYAGRGTRSTVGNCVIPVPGGRGVGGSTLINSAICFRTPDVILKEWSEQYGCTRLTKEKMTPLLDRVWSTIGVTVNPVIFQKSNNLIFKKGADALGLPGDWLPRSAPGCIGCGVCQLGCPTGGKLSADRSFLPIALETGNASVHADCRVEGVATEQGRVTRVTGRFVDPADLKAKGGFSVSARAFVSCAGPIGTPRFLLNAGLTDDSVVGQNLFMHPTRGQRARVDHAIKPWHGVTQGYCVDRWEQGYLLQVYTLSPDQLFMAMPYSLGSERLDAVRDLRNMALAGPLVHDEDSRGRVTAKGLIYFLGDQDRRRLLAGIRETARVFFAAGARAVYTGIVGSKPIRSPADIENVVSDDIPARDLYLYASHPMSTVRMGDDPGRAGVDPDGRVFGWDNLFVADASLFPTSLGVNPQVSTMALGLTVGQSVAESLNAV